MPTVTISARVGRRDSGRRSGPSAAKHGASSTTFVRAKNPSSLPTRNASAPTTTAGTSSGSAAQPRRRHASDGQRGRRGPCNQGRGVACERLPLRDVRPSEPDGLPQKPPQLEAVGCRQRAREREDRAGSRPTATGLAPRQDGDTPLHSPSTPSPTIHPPCRFAQSAKRTGVQSSSRGRPRQSAIHEREQDREEQHGEQLRPDGRSSGRRRRRPRRAAGPRRLAGRRRHASTPARRRRTCQREQRA